MKIKSLFKSGRKGFTIVELLVAMSVFVILVTIATGAFIQALRSERRLLALMSITNNASLVLEQMAREIRTGYKFTNDGGVLRFSSTASAGGVSYALVGGKIQRNGQDLTAANMNVSNLFFSVSQAICDPWRVTIAATVNVFPASASVNPITIQTSASSRILPRDMPRADKDGTPFRLCE